METTTAPLSHGFTGSAYPNAWHRVDPQSMLASSLHIRGCTVRPLCLVILGPWTPPDPQGRCQGIQEWSSEMSRLIAEDKRWFSFRSHPNSKACNGVQRGQGSLSGPQEWLLERSKQPAASPDRYHTLASHGEMGHGLDSGEVARVVRPEGGTVYKQKLALSLIWPLVLEYALGGGKAFIPQR